MTKFIIPAILISISAIGFFMFTNPAYKEIGAMRAQSASYDEALNNSKSLESERDKLTQKENALNPDSVSKLNRLLPDNVDNIRLILEMEQVAAPHGMVLKDIHYDTDDATASSASAVKGAGAIPSATPVAVSRKDYGTWNLEFSTSGSYTEFLKFLRDLENNLRIVDISSIEFSSSDGTPATSKPGAETVYKYNVKLQTYWLKN